MKNLKEFENHLDHQWKAFSKTLSAQTRVSEIKKGIDEDLLKDLSASSFFSEKVEIAKRRSMSADREKEWAEARRVELLTEKLFAEQMDLTDFNLLSSISHSSGADSVVVCISLLNAKNIKPNIQGVGVDIENVDRKISEDVAKRFQRRDDVIDTSQYSELTNIALWVLKESAFKATPKDLQLVVSEYKLTKWNTESREGEMVSKNARCMVKLVKHSGFLVGLSYFSF